MRFAQIVIIALLQLTVTILSARSRISIIEEDNHREDTSALFQSPPRWWQALAQPLRNLAQISRAPPEETSLIECSEFKQRQIRQQCDNRTAQKKLGKMSDRHACAEACRQKAAQSQEQVCCVFSQVDTCWAYPGAGPIVDGKKRAIGSAVSVRGAATVCKVSEAIIPGRSGSSPGNDDAQARKMARQELKDEAKEMALDQHNTGRMQLMNAQKVAMFRNVHPAEVVQGGVGNCWMMAAIASLAQYPAAVRKLFGSWMRTTDRVHEVQVYNIALSQWNWITVSDEVPASEFGPLYARLPLDRTGWVLLLEKAIAKFGPQADRGKGYENLHGSFGGLGVALLSGSSTYGVVTISHNKHGGVKIIGGQQTIRSDGMARWGSTWPFWARDVASMTWNKLTMGTSDSRLMVASIYNKNSTSTSETQLANGLYDGHGYSVLQAREFHPSKGANSSLRR
jgi:hypothetical protein